MKTEIMNKKRKYTTAMLALLLAAAPLELMAQKLQVVKGEVDCGKVGYEMPVTATFELKNKGGRKLKITDVRVSCGCTQVDYPKGEVGAGDKFTISLTYDARMLGHFEKSVGILTNGSSERVYLKMKGVVMADYVDYTKDYPYQLGMLRTDKRDLEFDDVNKGDMPTQEINFVNVGSSTFEPNLMHLPPYLSAQVMPEKVPSGKSGKILVTLNSNKLRDFGLTQTSVYLANMPGEKVSPDNEVTVSTVLLPNFEQVKVAAQSPSMSLSAEELNLPLGDKAKKTGEIIITNNGKATLNIRSLQMFTVGIKVTLVKREIQPGQSTKMKVTAYKDELKKVRTKPRVLMITNDPAKPKVTITIKAK